MMNRIWIRSVTYCFLALVPLGWTRPALLAQQTQLALTPPMGWNDWYQYECKVSDAIVRMNADTIVDPSF
jgi:alpha-galactosidase